MLREQRDAARERERKSEKTGAKAGVLGGENVLCFDFDFKPWGLRWGKGAGVWSFVLTKF